MKNLLQKINHLDYGKSGTPLQKEDILHLQIVLKDCGRPQIPTDVVEFLSHYNGFLREGRCIFGINNQNHGLYDILHENLLPSNPTPENLLLLGSTETTYIGWLSSSKCYSIIDNSTFMVLHKFNNFVEAIQYVLKIND